jgi:hypothetical protein
MSQSDNNVQMKILLFGMIEMIIGFSGVILADFYSIFNLLTLLSGLAGLAALLFCVTQPAKIKLYDFLAMALILAYGSGTLNSLVTYTIDGMDLLKSSLVEEYWLSRSLGLVTAAAGFLHVIGRADSESYLFKNISFNETDKNRFFWFAFFIFVLTVIFIATGKLGFMGSVAIAKGYVNVSPSSAILLDLILPVGAVAFYIGLKEDTPKIKRLFIVVGLMLLFIQFGFSRRVFVFSALIYLTIFFLMSKPFRLLSLKNIVIFLIFGVVIQTVTTSYQILRISTYQNKNTEKSIFQMVPDAIKVYEDKDFYHVDENIHNNLRSRTFVLEYLAREDKALSTIEPIYGTNLLRALVVSVPRIFFPSKYTNELFLQEENFIGSHFKLPITDSANTVITGSLADFGEVGVFLLPLLLCFIYSRILSACRKYMNPISSVFIAIFFSYRLISVEADIGIFFSTLRALIIFWFILWLLFNVNKKTPPLKSASS